MHFFTHLVIFVGIEGPLKHMHIDVFAKLLRELLHSLPNDESLDKAQHLILALMLQIDSLY